MNVLLVLLAAFLLANMLAGLARIWRGPTPADRLLAAQLFGTTGVATLLVLANALSMPALRDVALVLALLAATASVVFVRRLWVPDNQSEPGDVV